VSNITAMSKLFFNQPVNTYSHKKEESFTHKREDKDIKKGLTVKKDIYSKNPVRLLGFTNEVGAALSPIIGPVGELISYIPAFSYIFMDTRDKYKRGDDGTYKQPSNKKAMEQLTFQAFASVILPTAAVKTSQAIANKIIDSKILKTFKNSVTSLINKKSNIKNFIQKFADKPSNSASQGVLIKFASGFQKAIETITVFPLFFKHAHNKSGLRNIGLAAVGLTTLALVIKPIDNFVEKVIIGKVVKPMLKNKENS